MGSPDIKGIDRDLFFSSEVLTIARKNESGLKMGRNGEFVQRLWGKLGYFFSVLFLSPAA